MWGLCAPGCIPAVLGSSLTRSQTPEATDGCGRGLFHLTASKVSVHNQSHLSFRPRSARPVASGHRTSWQVHVAEQSWETRQGEEGARVPLKVLIFPCWSKSSNVPLHPIVTQAGWGPSLQYMGLWITSVQTSVTCLEQGRFAVCSLAGIKTLGSLLLAIRL